MKTCLTFCLLLMAACMDDLPADDIYVSCLTNKSVVRLSGEKASTFATSEVMILGMAADRSGNIYLSDTARNTIFEYKAVNGVLSDTPVVFASNLHGPMNLAFDPQGNLYEIESTDVINRFKYSKGHLSSEPGLFIDPSPDHANLKENRQPCYLAFDRRGNLYVSISIGGILKFSRSSSGLSKMPDKRPFSTVSRARQMAFDGKGNLFTANHLAGEICVYKFPNSDAGLSGTPEIFATGNGLDAPAGVGFDSEGNLYITNWGYNSGSDVLKYPNTDGVLSHTPVIWGPKFLCPILVWCEKPPPLPVPPKPKVYPQVQVPPPATPLTQPAQFYD